MTRDCTGCGARLNDDPTQKHWQCQYCGTITYNEEIIKRYAMNIDFKEITNSKVSNYLEIGFAAFNGNDYVKSLSYFEKALEEDPTKIDAWVYAALSIAQKSDLSNLSSSLEKIGSYLKKAHSINPTSEVALVGTDQCYRTVSYTLLRLLDRHLNEAEKVFFAYESVDKKNAKIKANQQYDLILNNASVALDFPISDSKIKCEIASYLIKSCNNYKGGCPSAELFKKAEFAIQEIEKINPNLYNQYSHLISRSTMSAKLKLLSGSGFFSKLLRK